MKALSIESGASVIRHHAEKLPITPGVYRMLNEHGEVLYVGKAKALKKRVLSYTHIEKLPTRLKRMVAETTSMEFVHTHTEVEALLLESNLIKKLKPKFNILLRDDKSFPYILITGDHDFPQIKKHRGSKRPKGDYFGPFASAGAVNHTLQILQRVFLLRNCSDHVFANRKRPCLQYHIKRCTAPCVDKVSKEEYAQQVEQAALLLKGDSRVVQEALAAKMQKASDEENFERAAEYRDRLKTLSTIQSEQDINIQGISDADVMALVQKNGTTCVEVFFFRGGQNFGNRSYFPRHDKDDTPDAIMANFMAQFYDNKPIPAIVMVNVVPDDSVLLIEALKIRRQANVEVSKPQRGQRKRLIDFVERNAEDSLKRHLAVKTSEAKHLQAVADLFDMDASLERIEVYDNSHLGGTNMVGGMIVSGPEGFIKNSYRKFNIRDSVEGDDYGMMREVMKRRFTSALKEPNKENWPDLLLIDGGKGQLSAVTETLEELGVFDEVTVVAIAKGEDRNAGREEFFMRGKSPFKLPVNDPTLHYLQRLRDEAHRFAIGAQRVRRKNDMVKSPLDQIAGIGAKRKKALLLYFGSAKAVGDASIQDLQKVDGISKAVAEKIYNYFH